MIPLACLVLLLTTTQPADPAPMATPPGWLAEAACAEALIERGQPLEAAEVYETYTTTQPWFPAAHYLRVGALIDAGRSDLVADALDRARRAIPRTAPLRREAAMFVLDIAATRENLPREDARRLVAEARALVDDALPVDPSFTEGLTTKASVLLLEAERLAQDPARKSALQAEADALYQKAFAPPSSVNRSSNAPGGRPGVTSRIPKFRAICPLSGPRPSAHILRFAPDSRGVTSRETCGS